MAFALAHFLLCAALGWAPHLVSAGQLLDKLSQCYDTSLFTSLFTLDIACVEDMLRQSKFTLNQVKPTLKKGQRGVDRAPIESLSESYILPFLTLTDPP